MAIPSGGKGTVRFRAVILRATSGLLSGRISMVEPNNSTPEILQLEPSEVGFRMTGQGNSETLH
jgi:hypothetical protein